uniref:Uncharacterized protein n=1 Tax=Arundo donax TaxID=35708 RepID=A0A0A9HF66_ARUDO
MLPVLILPHTMFSWLRICHLNW